jgi:hypothetical protein
VLKDDLDSVAVKMKAADLVWRPLHSQLNVDGRAVAETAMRGQFKTIGPLRVIIVQTSRAIWPGSSSPSRTPEAIIWPSF